MPRGEKTRVWERQKLIIWTSYILEFISQPPYSHYMDPVGYDFTKILKQKVFVSGAFNGFTNNRGRWPDMLYMVSLVA